MSSSVCPGWPGTSSTSELSRSGFADITLWWSLLGWRWEENIPYRLETPLPFALAYLWLPWLSRFVSSSPSPSLYHYYLPFFSHLPIPPRAGQYVPQHSSASAARARGCSRGPQQWHWLRQHVQPRGEWTMLLTCETFCECHCKFWACLEAYDLAMFGWIFRGALKQRKSLAFWMLSLQDPTPQVKVGRHEGFSKNN